MYQLGYYDLNHTIVHSVYFPVPPPSSHSSGIGSSGSDLDTSRGAEGEICERERTDMESEV